MSRESARRGFGAMELAWAGAAAVAIGATLVLAAPDTTLEDFFQPGTQPGMMIDPTLAENACSFCHGGYDSHTEPYFGWKSSMMGQAWRDPIFLAAFSIANQDAAFAGDLCLRCHTPNGWLNGRSVPTTGDDLLEEDFQGVTCSVCHRMADPVYVSGQSPEADWSILTDLAAVSEVPQDLHSAQYVIDPYDRRRGPFQLTDMFYHQWEQSPFHADSRMCATCHDVSNPLFERGPGGTYVLGPTDTRHSTGRRADMFPIERTYSEWAQSEFALGPIDMGGRFGGNKLEVSSCQDCHMPDASGYGARPTFGAEYRDDVPTHGFAGANSWGVRAARASVGEAVSGVTMPMVEASEARNLALMQAAADLHVSRPMGVFDPDTLLVRVVNQSGHKLPTGYPEGRRMWLNVRFYDASNALIAERGVYNPTTAAFDGTGTKVYQAKLGLDASMSALTGKPQGPGFHFALNNTWFFDNRIPPRGFTNAGFASVQAAPVAYTYQDGQYWDNTLYEIPAGAMRADVSLLHQTTTKEFIEFLRDTNTTDSRGIVAYEIWEALGKSAPVTMATVSVSLSACGADFDGSGEVDVLDFLDFIDAFGQGLPRADVNADGMVDVLDVLDFFDAFGVCLG